jgi:hypothetical protein
MAVHTQYPHGLRLHVGLRLGLLAQPPDVDQFLVSSQRITLLAAWMIVHRLVHVLKPQHFLQGTLDGFWPLRTDVMSRILV